MDIKKRLDFLCSVDPGDIWTEFHWREVSQVRQEVLHLVACDNLCRGLGKAILAAFVVGALIFGWAALCSNL